MNLDSLINSNILEILHLTDAPRSTQDEAINSAQEIIVQSVRNRIQDLIPEDARDQFYYVFQKGTDEQRSAFLNQHAINLEDIVAQETLRYKYITEIIASENSHES